MTDTPSNTVRYRITHTTKYSYSEPVPVCMNKAHLSPRSTPTQTCCDFRLLVSPQPSDVESRADYFGNPVNYFSIQSAHRQLSITSFSSIDMTERPEPVGDGPAWEDVARAVAKPTTDDTFGASLFTYPSDYIDLPAECKTIAEAIFTPGKAIVAGCRELTKYVFDNFKYTPGSTNVDTELSHVLQQKSGVCQDFAHLEIACLRSLRLPARYVSGYLRTLPPPGKPRLVGADASHAWLSVYCGDLGWIDFDPTNNVIPKTDHITVAYGRDYADVCPIQGVFVGGGDHSMSVSVDVEQTAVRTG